MPGRIPDELIDSIRLQADIVDVIVDYVTLKKSGKNYLGLCPFHNEKTPSFNVSPERQIFHCFGCGRGGNVFTFLMEHEKINFIEAVRLIARKLNIPIPETGRETVTSSEHESLYRVTQFAAKFYHDRLMGCDQTDPVRQYVTRRGLSDETLVAFAIGYAPDKWDELLHAAERQGITPAWLQKAGLATAKGDHCYDTFRHRLIFPIFSLSGRVIGFGGRALDDEVQPKYLNSPETPIYQKSRIVYGLHQTKEAVRRAGRVIVVEGYIDLLSVHQAGIEPVVATCGTALTTEQARLLVRYATDAVLVYDADEAGVRATIRGLDPLVEAGLWTRIVPLPAGEDPDTYVRRYGRDGFAALLDQTTTMAEFIAAQYDISSSEGREAALQALAGVITRVSNLRHRERYLEEAERRLPIPPSLLMPVLRMAQAGRRLADRPAETRTSRFEDPERELLRLMLQHAEIKHFVVEHLHPTDFTDPTYSAIVQYLVEMIEADRPSDPARLIDDITDDGMKRLIAELSAAEDTGADREKRARDYIKRIKQEQIKRARERIKQQLIELQQTGGETPPTVLEELYRLKIEEQALHKSVS